MKQFLALSFIFSASHFASANDNTHTLQLQDIFNLEYANQIDITDDGKTVYFVRNRMDIKTDRKVGNIWSVDYNTEQLQLQPNSILPRNAAAMYPNLHVKCVRCNLK